MSTNATANVRRLPLADRPKIILPYERVSAIMGRDDEVFRSPDLQRKANLQSIANGGHSVYQDAIDHPELYRDVDKTGRDFNRSGIQRALDLKRRGLIDGIAVLDVSRVGRTSGETLEVIERFREDGGVFISTREHIDNTPTGDLMLTIMVALAQLYSDNIALGWRAVIEERFQNGLHNGRVPLGYQYACDENGKTIKPARVELDERTAPLVREAFHRYAAGESMTRLSRWLTSQKVRNATSLRPLLENPFYVGDVTLTPWTGKAKKRKRNKDAPKAVMRGRHPILLADNDGAPDRELFERVQKRLERERYTARRHATPVHALSGLAHCANCDRALVAGPVRGVFYMRDHNGRRLDKCVGCGAAQTDKLEAVVLHEVRQLVDGFELGVGEQVAQLRSRATLKREHDALTAALLTLDTAETKADAAHFSGKLSEARYARLCEQYASERASITARLADFQLDESEPDELAVVEAARELFERWETATPAERNVMLRACGVRSVRVREARSYREPLADRTEVVFAL